MRTLKSTFWLAITAVWSPACLQEADPTDTPVDALDKERLEEASELGLAESDITSNAGVFDVGVIPDSGVGCPANSEEIVIRMDDEDTANVSSLNGFVGKTNFQETGSGTRFYFCKVKGEAFRPFSTSINASNQRDDYAVLKLGTACPTGSEEFSRYFDNEDTNNQNFFIGDITPNLSIFENTTLFFCLFRFASSGVGTISSFPSFGAGFRYGVFGPSDFNRGALAIGTIKTDDEDDANNNSYDAPNDALSAAQRIIQPDPNVSHGATILHVLRAR
jgi:hypothetical protein